MNFEVIFFHQVEGELINGIRPVLQRQRNGGQTNNDAHQTIIKIHLPVHLQLLAKGTRKDATTRSINDLLNSVYRMGDRADSDVDLRISAKHVALVW